MIFDAHAYLGTNPEFVAFGLPLCLDADWLLRSMDEQGIDAALVAPPSAGRDEFFVSDLELIARAIEARPDRIFGYARVMPRRGKAALTDLRYWIEERGLHAIKMNTLDDEYRLDDRELIDPFVELADELRVPVLFHTGDVHAATCTPLMVADIAADFPDTTFIIGHIGYPGSDREIGAALKRSSNTVVESASVFRLDVIQRAVVSGGAQRVLMGSNSPYSPLGLAPRMIRDCMPALSSEEKEAILGKNLARLLGLAL